MSLSPCMLGLEGNREMPKFLHTADWQWGRQYSRFAPEVAVPLAEARLQAVERLAALAVAESVDAILVAGDVFDLQTLPERQLRRLATALEGFPGPWVLLPGNHDAALAESVWQRVQRGGFWPAHALLALTPEPVLLPECRTAVLPAPLTQRHTYQDTTAWMDHAETPEGWCRVGLAHGSVQGILAEDIDSANPIAPSRPESARLDYLALGDWHGFKQVSDRAAYSGTPEPDRFRQNDSGQVLLVEIEGPGRLPVITPRAVALHQWLQHGQRLQDATDIDALAGWLAALPAHTVLQLTLSGRLSLEEQQRLDAVLAPHEARLRCLEVERSGLALAPSEAELRALPADGFVADVLWQLRSELAQANEALGALGSLPEPGAALTAAGPSSVAAPGSGDAARLASLQAQRDQFALSLSLLVGELQSFSGAAAASAAPAASRPELAQEGAP